jgi:hypothetical protein
VHRLPTNRELMRPVVVPPILKKLADGYMLCQHLLSRQAKVRHYFFHPSVSNRQLQKKHLESTGVSVSRSADDANHATTFLRCSLHQHLQCKFYILNRLQPKGRHHHVLEPKASSNITATIEGCNSPWTRHGCWLHGCRPIHSPSGLACFQMSSGEAEVRFDDEISPRENGANAAIRNTRPLSPATTRTYTCAPHLWRYH